MIALSALKYLAAQKIKDADVLLNENRHTGAIYLMGYALEFVLKRKVSQTIGFNNGFPESTADFNSYAVQTNTFTISTGISLTKVKQIRNHDLNQLLTFSGVEPTILSGYYDEWMRVKDWNPESRYNRQRISHDKAKEFVISTKKILKQIV